MADSYSFWVRNEEAIVADDDRGVGLSVFCFPGSALRSLYGSGYAPPAPEHR
jgi:hypothetical protein